MIWVGSFHALRSVLRRPRSTNAPFEVHTWVRTEIGLISPIVDWLMGLVTASGCLPGEERFVELAVREALSNAMLHGNRLHARKLVHVRCCCQSGKGVFIVVRDQGRGFDPHQVPDPLAPENLAVEHGRGIHLMKVAMDEVSFKRGGTEVRMRKASAEKQTTPARHAHDRFAGWIVRPSQGRLSCRVAPAAWPCGECDVAQRPNARVGGAAL